MFVLSSKQFASLLSIEAGFQYESLLDLGAGDGMVTQKMAVFFHHVYVTEVSRPMCWRLREHGFTVLDADTWELDPPPSDDGSDTNPVPKRFDVISCLNLLDRCDAPLTMLKRIAGALKPRTGRLVLGIVLPLKQYVETKPDKSASEILDLPDSESWEVQLNHLLSDVLPAAGFELVTWTRVPYLCEGDFTQSFYYLNDLVLVFRVRHTLVIQSGVASPPPTE
ncbi:unnamed protein product [Echinostoma caproni]|uniref:Methyltransferase-like protein 9 n=1 Tax=Echinostoma caproni TaxID=27848 RepID=A0A183ALL3_9TREM|nr:unnamed protein product [Echinostoma caproni]